MASLSKDLLNKINPGRETQPNATGAPNAAAPVPAATVAPVMTNGPTNTVVIKPDDPAPQAAHTHGTNLQSLLDKLAEPQEGQPLTDAAQPIAEAAAQESAQPIAPFTLPDAAAFPELAPQAATPTPGAGTSDAELVALRKQLTTVTETLEQQRTDSEREKSRREREQQLEADIRQRFGAEVPDTVLQEFGDILSAARAQVGSELGLEYGRQMLDLQDQVESLKATLEAKATTYKESPGGTITASAEDLTRQERQLMQTYQQNLAATVPFYSEVMKHPNLGQMLDMPVNDLDPNRTWDVALGQLFANRDTANIARFVEQFHSSYVKPDKRKSRAVPAPNSNGNSAETRHATPDSNTLSREDLDALYKASMRGEIKLTDDQRLKLRKAFAAQSS